MSRPTRTQMISPSPTCTRRRTTPRTRRSAPTVTSRGSWTGGNLEGQKRGTSQSCKVVSSRSVGGDCVATRGKSPKMLSEPTIAMMIEVEGYATLTSLFLQFTVESGYVVYRVVFSLRRIPKRPQLQLSDKNLNENGGRVVKSQSKIHAYLNCIVIYIISWLVMMTVSLADVHRAGNVRTKLRPMHGGPIRGKLPVTFVYDSLLFPALTQSSGCRQPSGIGD